MSRPLRGKTSSKTVLKARRQHPFGPYILDFFCVQAQLAVELDGSVHDQTDQKEFDENRTAYLESHGLRLLRFKNLQVEGNIDNVLARILELTSPNPRPLPSPEVFSGEGRDAGGRDG
jgi:very-short-patch-repair endonuclease